MNTYKASADASSIPYRVARGDELLQDVIISQETIRAGLDMLAQHGGDLAYTPEMSHRFEEVLQRRFETNDGWDQFQMPNSAPYDNPEMAAFYGCDTSDQSNIMKRKETFQETKERLLKETVEEIESEMAGLSQMMGHFSREGWARHGVANETPYSHADLDTSLLRNPDKGWSALDRPAATSDKSNVIDMYDAVPDHTFATPHEGWLVDRNDGFWDTLPTSTASEPYR